MSGIGLPGLDTSMLTFASRLATFNIEHQVSKRRASSQKKKQPSAVSWPHLSPSAEELARAGFFYKPAPDSDDNVQCFHCAVKLDGWESEDIPLREHLAHSSQCAWAISLSVSDKAEDRDPMDPDLLEARKSTFANLWPHEKKKGWRCKVNKMVDAGWSYDPSPSDEDGATCFYCNLSLDGWEPKDNPTDEHRKREPNCPFFALVEHYKPTRKGARGRTSTASKASRLSTQSMKSTFSEAPSLMSLGDAGPDTDMEESLAIDTTISSDTGKGRKKTTKGKKKTSRQASVEPSITYPTLQDAVDDTIEPVAVEEKPKAKRGRKPKTAQDSTLMEDSTIAEPVKKATRGRAKAKEPSPEHRISQDESQLQSELQEAAEFASALQSPPPENARGTKRTSDGLEKTITNEEIAIEEAPAKPKKVAKATKGKKGKKATQEIQDESEAPAEDTDITAPQADVKPKRVRSKKAKEVEPELEPEPEVYSEHEQEFEPEIQEPEPQEEPALAPEPEDFEGAYDELEAQQDGENELEPDMQAEPEVEDDEQPEEIIEQEPELEEDEQSEQEVEQAIEPEVEVEVEVVAEAEEEAEEPVQSSVHEDEEIYGDVEVQDDIELEQPEDAASLAPTPAAEEFEPTPTPKSTRLSVVHRQTPEPAPQSAHSTPQSHRSSDAENHPPSSSTHAQTTIKKSTTLTSEAENSALKPKEVFASPSKAVRIPLATSTPNRSPRRSPSKFGQLTSSVPWEPVDLDSVFYPLTENENANEDDVLAKMLEAGGALTTPEKKMSVEEWIRWRAELGETKLKNECERMVTLFEREANRGLQALNGIKTVE